MARPIEICAQQGTFIACARRYAELGAAPYRAPSSLSLCPHPTPCRDKCAVCAASTCADQAQSSARLHWCAEHTAPTAHSWALGQWPRAKQDDPALLLLNTAGAWRGWICRVPGHTATSSLIRHSVSLSVLCRGSCVPQITLSLCWLNRAGARSCKKGQIRWCWGGIGSKPARSRTECAPERTWRAEHVTGDRKR